MRRVTRQSVGAIIMAALLVTALAGAPANSPDPVKQASPVGEADAIVCGGACLAGGVIIGAGLGVAAAEALDSSDGTAYTRADKQETMEEVEVHSDTLRRDQDVFVTTMNNQVLDGSRTVAWTKVKNQTVYGLNNNQTKAQAKANATAAAQDHYSATVMNINQQWMHQAQKASYLRDVWRNHQDLSQNPFVNGNGNDIAWDTVNGSLTLPNGSTVPTKSITLKQGGTTNVLVSPFPNDKVSHPNSTLSLASPTGSESNVKLRSTTYTDSSLVLDTYDYKLLITDTYDASTQMTSNAELHVDNTYASYNSGDLSISEYMDGATLAKQFSTDYDSTGFNAYAAGSLAVMGVDGNLNHSMQVTINGSETVNGTLFADWKPSKTNGSFKTGTTYDPANTSSPVWIATSGNLRIVEEPFVINSMTNTRTGNATNQTTTQSYNKQTADVTLTQEQLQNLIDIREEINDREASAAGGSGGWGLGGFDGPTGIALIALIAAFVGAIVLKD